MKVDVVTATQKQFDCFLRQLSRRKAHNRIECDIISSLGRDLDLEVYERLRIEFLKRGECGSERKYLDILYWLRAKLKDVVDHDMHLLPPQRLLDLGSGPGHFPFLCQRFGHHVTALDQGHIELYDKLIEFFDVQRIEHVIRPFRPLPRFTQEFDLVSGFMVGFNKRADGELLDDEEWLYFFKDIADNVLARSGRLVLKLIRNARMPGLHFYDQPFIDLVTSHGGTIDLRNGYVIFESMTKFAAVAPAKKSSAKDHWDGLMLDPLSACRSGRSREEDNDLSQSTLQQIPPDARDSAGERVRPPGGRVLEDTARSCGA